MVYEILLIVHWHEILSRYEVQEPRQDRANNCKDKKLEPWHSKKFLICGIIKGRDAKSITDSTVLSENRKFYLANTSLVQLYSAYISVDFFIFY